MANQQTVMPPLVPDETELQDLRKHAGYIKLFDASKNRLAAREAINRLEEISHIASSDILRQARAVASKLDELGILLEALPNDTSLSDRTAVKGDIRFYTSIFLQLREMYLSSKSDCDDGDKLADFPIRPNYPDSKQEADRLSIARDQVPWELSSWTFTTLSPPSLNSATATDRWAQVQQLEKASDSDLNKWAYLFIHGVSEVGNLRRYADSRIAQRLDKLFAKLFFAWLRQQEQIKAEYSLIDLVLIVADLGGYFKLEDKGIWQVVSARLGLKIDQNPQTNWIESMRVCDTYQRLIRDFEPRWRSTFGLGGESPGVQTTCSTAGPSATPPPKVVGRRPRRSTKSSRPGILSGFMALPIEMLGEVAEHLTPNDLLNLSRTSKRLRSLMLSNRSWWIRAINSIPQNFPKFPRGISEQELISLCFDSSCQMCGRDCPPLSHKTGVTFFGKHYELMRYCSSNCCQRWVCDSGYQGFVHDFGPSMAHLFSLITFHDPSWSSKKKEWNVAYATMLVGKFYRACGKSTTKFIDFLEAWKPAATSKFISDLYAWKERVRQQMKEQVLESEENRWISIRTKLVELGYEENDFPQHSFRWREITRKPRPLTPLIWKRIQPELVALIAKNKPAATNTNSQPTEVNTPEVLVVDEVMMMLLLWTD
ncbi:hypothetical protein FRC02_004058 [Tulasnella sp. 418]|nr:hypothetical protein FRC02_004058 [Tulasnella sp. 418]